MISMFFDDDLNKSQVTTNKHVQTLPSPRGWDLEGAPKTQRQKMFFDLHPPMLPGPLPGGSVFVLWEKGGSEQFIFHFSLVSIIFKVFSQVKKNRK